MARLGSRSEGSALSMDSVFYGYDADISYQPSIGYKESIFTLAVAAIFIVKNKNEAIRIPRI
jgi:hypothetical protein